MSGASNLLLTCRENRDDVAILKVETADQNVILPESLWDKPVTELGHHIFAPGGQDMQGKQIRIVGGSESADAPDNRKIRRITLPDTVRTVGSYAFYNCDHLRELRLSDHTCDWGGSTLMNCRLLNRFVITLSDSRAGVLEHFTDELSRELDVTLVYPNGELARLIFPEYWEAFEENTPAKHFDCHIYGVGYPYHCCFRDKALSLAEFDRAWQGHLRAGHDVRCALRLAFYRVRYPRELLKEAGERYLKYLKNHTGEVLSWLLEEKDTRSLAWFLAQAEPSREEVAAACDQARRRNAAEALALLLETQHRRFPAGQEKTFDL
ncbi:MAG: leucine-rich repeat domain-containing protein [Intestinimonas sp.]|jgi:hypothetical protein|nr:leucine-rich repeat domain-containing protein [Intestinimonas sp.]